MTGPGTIAALVGLGNQLAGRCDSVVKSIADLPAKDPRSSSLNVISSYCAILQAAVQQVCAWAGTNLPKSTIPTSSVITIQAAIADLLEFIELLHDHLRVIYEKSASEPRHVANYSAGNGSILAQLSQGIQKLAGSLQLMVAATMMPIESARSVLLDASESISSNWKNMRTDWNIEQGVSGLSLEDSLLSSPVYQRVSRYELEANSVGSELPAAERHIQAESLRRTVPEVLESPGIRQRLGLPGDQLSFPDPGLMIPKNVFDVSPNASTPSILTHTNRTIGQESHVHLLPSHQTSDSSSPSTSLIAVQPGLIPVAQPGLIAVESKYDARNGLIPANRNRLSPSEKQISGATSAQSLVLSLDGDGFLGSYCHLLVLQELYQKVATFESSEPTGEYSGPNVMTTHYFDEVVGTGTGGLIAILLGRLQLPLGECIKAFQEMGKKLLDPHNFDTTRSLSPVELAIQYRRLLKQVVRETVETYSYLDPASTSFYQTTPESCRTVITSFDLSYSGSSTGAHTFYSSLRSRDKSRTRELLRGYRNPETWRVCLATLEHRLSVQPSLLKDVPFIDESVQEKSPAVRLYRKIVSDNGNDPRAVKALICMGTRERSGKAATSQPWNYSYEWLSKQNPPAGVTCYRFELHRKFKAFSLEGGNDREVQSKLASAETLAREYLSSSVVQDGLTMCAKLLVQSRQARAQRTRQGS